MWSIIEFRLKFDFLVTFKIFFRYGTIEICEKSFYPDAPDAQPEVLPDAQPKVLPDSQPEALNGTTKPSD